MLSSKYPNSSDHFLLLMSNSLSNFNAFSFLFLAFRYALKLLHSSSVDSTEKIRISLDDVIKQRHGSSKMLANTLSKKYLAEETSAPGVVQRHRSSDSKASSSNSPQQQITVTTDSSVVTTPIVISVPDDDDDDDLMEEAHLQVCLIIVNNGEILHSIT